MYTVKPANKDLLEKRPLNENDPLHWHIQKYLLVKTTPSQRSLFGASKAFLFADISVLCVEPVRYKSTLPYKHICVLQSRTPSGKWWHSGGRSGQLITTSW